MDHGRSARVRAELESILGARYEILDLHGQGGMGMVFCARERALERLVAIKVLVPDAGLGPEARQRFRNEARHAAALSHPSIVPVFELGESGDLPYIVMEFVRGESLGRRLRYEVRLSPEVTRSILLDLADALDHAHRRGIIHRDIKPENILIKAESGRAMLADFGIAKQLDGPHLTRTGVGIGTPLYMSPEQAAGERDIDHRTDLYSLGAVGYTMLAGRPPHQNDGVHDVRTKHIIEEPTPLRELAPEAPQDLVAAIGRCLEKSPEKRWQDARALYRALARDAADDDPVSEELRGVTGFGAFMAMLLAVALVLALRAWAADERIGAIIALLGGVLLAAGFLNHMQGIAAGRDTLRDVLRVSMWPPKWWGLWWPAALRRPGDVWECLPASAKGMRAFLTFMFGAILAWLVMRSALPDVTQDRGDTAVLALVVLGVGVIATGLTRWRSIGFPLRDVSRLLFGPTVGATFWSQPHVSSVLITRPDAEAACATPVPDSARGMLHEIEAAVGQLVGQTRATGSSVAEAAQLLLADIERLDGEIEMLVRDTDAEELERIERRLSGMHDSQHDARLHLEEYAKIIRGQRDLLEIKRYDRDDAGRTLRTIWTVLQRLRDHSGGGPSRETELVQQLEALAAAARSRPRPARYRDPGGVFSPPR